MQKLTINNQPSAVNGAIVMALPKYSDKPPYTSGKDVMISRVGLRRIAGIFFGAGQRILGGQNETTIRTKIRQRFSVSQLAFMGGGM